jgi:hypothetical protein
LNLLHCAAVARQIARVVELPARSVPVQPFAPVCDVAQIAGVLIGEAQCEGVIGECGRPSAVTGRGLVAAFSLRLMRWLIPRARVRATAIAVVSAKIIATIHVVGGIIMAIFLLVFGVNDGLVHVAFR